MLRSKLKYLYKLVKYLTTKLHLQAQLFLDFLLFFFVYLAAESQATVSEEA